MYHVKHVDLGGIGSLLFYASYNGNNMLELEDEIVSSPKLGIGKLDFYHWQSYLPCRSRQAC